ncbi:MAG: endonuclease/exonuclease/phosphatase family protein [Candidatus Binatia bacterium]
MRLRIRLLLLLFVVAQSGAVSMASSPASLRCLTFNMLHGGVFSGWVGNGQELDHRLEIMLEEFQALDVDILALQEASTGNSRGNVAERIAERLGFYFAYAPAGFRLFSFEPLNTVTNWVMNLTEGPAIVSRFPIVSWQAYDLPRCGRFTDPRVLLCAELNTPWGPVVVCSTHTSGLPCQTESIVRLTNKHRAALPLLLMGDFNAPEDSPTIAVLTQGAGFVDTFRLMNPKEAGKTVWQRVDVTYSTVFRRVDYVFLAPRPDLPMRVASSRVVLNTPRQQGGGRVLWPSDHYGVFTEVQITPRSKEPG